MLAKFHAYSKARAFHLGCKALRLKPYFHDQLFRGSASIAINLAEGSGKGTGPERRRYYSIALGSIRECEAILDLAEVANPELRKQLDDLGGMVYRLCQPAKS